MIRLIDPFGVNRSDNKLSLRLRVIRVIHHGQKTTNSTAQQPCHPGLIVAVLSPFFPGNTFLVMTR